MTRTLSGKQDGSLIATIDFCTSAPGSRLLLERLANPLTDTNAIIARHDEIDCYLNEPALREDIRQQLKQLPDLARALSRLALQRGGPRDLSAIRNGLQAAREIHALVPDEGEQFAAIAYARAGLAALPDELETEISQLLADELPLKTRDGGFIRSGYDEALDEARSLRDAQQKSHRVVASGL